MNSPNLTNLPDQITIDGNYTTGEVHINGRLLNPESSLKLRNHSPDGFMWGYAGSGPSQLALAILLKFLPQETALSLYQNFKNKVVANWPQRNIEINLNFREIIIELSKQYAHEQC